MVLAGGGALLALAASVLVRRLVRHAA